MLLFQESSNWSRILVFAPIEICQDPLLLKLVVEAYAPGPGKLGSGLIPERVMEALANAFQPTPKVLTFLLRCIDLLKSDLTLYVPGEGAQADMRDLLR